MAKSLRSGGYDSRVPMVVVHDVLDQVALYKTVNALLAEIEISATGGDVPKRPFSEPNAF
jgi:hypothetical protein